MLHVRKNNFIIYITAYKLSKAFILSKSKLTGQFMNRYKNSYKVTEKELVSLSVYNVGFQNCAPLYQWGPGIRDHYLIHYIISGKGYYKIKNNL